MESSVQHISNLVFDTEPVLFRNDTNNVAALRNARQEKSKREEEARLQREKLEELRRLQEQEMLKATGDLEDQTNAKIKVQKELWDVRAEKEELSRDVARKDSELAALKAAKEEEITNLKTAKDGEIATWKAVKDGEIATLMAAKDGEIATLKAAKEEKERQVETLRVQKENEIQALMNQHQTLDSSRIAEIESWRNKWSSETSSKDATISAMTNKLPYSRLDNCLAWQFNGATVSFVNVRSLMALDAGKDGDTRICAWEYGRENANQIFKIEKSNNNLDQYWTITLVKNGKRLYFPSNDTGILVHCGNAIPGKQDFWYLGRGGTDPFGSYVIKNAEWGTHIELQNSNRTNDVPVLAYRGASSLDAFWMIIPITMTS